MQQFYNSNNISVRGLKDFSSIKLLEFPGILKKSYYINKNGQIYSIVNDKYESWFLKNGFPCVTLTCFDDKGLHKETFYVKDLVAYNYLENADSYLERGCKVVNIDGDPMNCCFCNIIYLDKKEINDDPEGK